MKVNMRLIPRMTSAASGPNLSKSFLKLLFCSTCKLQYQVPPMMYQCALVLCGDAPPCVEYDCNKNKKKCYKEILKPCEQRIHTQVVLQPDQTQLISFRTRTGLGHSP